MSPATKESRQCWVINQRRSSFPTERERPPGVLAIGRELLHRLRSSVIHAKHLNIERCQKSRHLGALKSIEQKFLVEFELTTPRNQIDLHVGEQVKRKRVARKIDIATLARLIGVTSDQMEKYESGASRITASRLQQIATVLDVNIARFFDDIPGESVVKLFPSAVPGHERDESITPLTADALELNRVFALVSDPLARKKIIDLAKSLANAKAEESTSGN